jgi:multiple sugar transport system ATP-binding protein
MASVDLSHVDKTYDGGAKAVDDFNLSISNREFIVLVGPSGCGKSTTLRMIAGLEEVSSGTISIDERVVNDVHPKNRDIAMVFQSYALYPHMTVYENMAFGLKMRKMPKSVIDSKVRRTANILGVTTMLERKPRQLSGGQRQRVALGRAIVRDPKCFLFDEPLSNLDAKLRVEMRVEIKRLHVELGSTTVYVTHDQEEAMTLGDRVVVMKDGVIQQCASALDIYHRPVNRFVAGFLGGPPMNFLEGRLVDVDGRLQFDEGSARLPVPAWAVEALRGQPSQSVILGIRPEALSDKARARFETDDNHISMKAWMVQPLGGTMHLHLSTPSHPNIVAQVDALQRSPAVAVGDSLPVFFDPNRMHFFEQGEMGRVLASAPGQGD